MEAHDKVASKCYETPHVSANSNCLLPSSFMPADAVRVIGIQKKAGEPLVSWPHISVTVPRQEKPLNLLYTDSYLIYSPSGDLIFKQPLNKCWFILRIQTLNIPHWYLWTEDVGRWLTAATPPGGHVPCRARRDGCCADHAWQLHRQAGNAAHGGRHLRAQRSRGW